jgi:hypothetical protein
MAKAECWTSATLRAVARPTSACCSTVQPEIPISTGSWFIDHWANCDVTCIDVVVVFFLTRVEELAPERRWWRVRKRAIRLDLCQKAGRNVSSLMAGSTLSTTRIAPHSGRIREPRGVSLTCQFIEIPQSIYISFLSFSDSFQDEPRRSFASRLGNANHGRWCSLFRGSQYPDDHLPRS